MRETPATLCRAPQGGHIVAGVSQENVPEVQERCCRFHFFTKNTEKLVSERLRKIDVGEVLKNRRNLVGSGGNMPRGYKTVNMPLKNTKSTAFSKFS